MSAWRCTYCGKISNAQRKPRWHRNELTDECGPFEPVVIAGEGAQLVAPAKPERPTTYRQSLLRSWDTCPRRTKFELALPGDFSTGNSGALADLGSAMHAVFAEQLRRLRISGREQPSRDEALGVMHEVIAAGPWVLPADERDTLCELVEAFALYHRWPTARILAIEEQLSVELVCPDGEVRTVTGQPDLLIALPGMRPGVEVTDFKSGWTRKDPRRMPPEGEPIVGVEYLSDRGHYQLDCYGVLVLHRYPSAQFVDLAETYFRTGGPPRVARLGRDELPEVERQIGSQMMLLDRAISEGEDSALWKPRPGRHCLRQCPVSASCPVPAEQRGVGALDSPEAADAAAARFVVVDAVRQQLRDQLKVRHEETGEAPAVGDGRALFWKDKPNGGRSFDVHDLADFKPEPEAVAA